MVKKPSGGWERVQIDEWAFSVAALHWDPDMYWQVSRLEFIEIRKAWLHLNGVDTRSDADKGNDEENESIQRLRVSLAKPIN